MVNQKEEKYMEENKASELLKKFAASKSKYFNLPEGEEAVVKLLSVEIVPNNFDGGKTNCVRYHLEVNGVELIWDRTSRELADQIAKYSIGDALHIKRIGQKNKTRYFIKKVSP